MLAFLLLFLPRKTAIPDNRPAVTGNEREKKNNDVKLDRPLPSFLLFAIVNCFF